MSFFLGSIPFIYGNTSEFYLIRMHNYNDAKAADIIIDYSIANIININSSLVTSRLFISKLIYIPPLLFDYNPHAGQHNIIITCFKIIGTNNRRNNIYSKLEKIKFYKNNIHNSSNNSNNNNNTSSNNIHRNINNNNSNNNSK